MNNSMKHYLDVANPQMAQKLVGIQSTSIWEKVSNEPALFELLGWRIFKSLGELEQPEDSLQALANCMSNFTEEQFHSLSRIVTCFLHAGAIREIVDGKFLTEILQFCELSDAIELIHRCEFPQLSVLPEYSHVTISDLQRDSRQVSSFLLGLLPVSYVTRIQFKFEPNAIPDPEVLSIEDTDRAALSKMASFACQRILSKGEDKNADH